MRRAAIAAILCCTIIACASGGTAPAGKDRNFISLMEIERARLPGWSTYDLISRLRPHFLRSPSAVSLEDRDPIFPVVYVDEIFHGQLESLREFSIDRLNSIEYLSPYDATTRFGSHIQGGAILIRTR